jgi:hypothetical protein
MATGTAEQLANVMRRRQALVEKEFRASSRGLAISAQRFARDVMTREIYAIPEDRTKSGKKKWRRTKLLLRSEKATVPDAYTVVLDNTAKYSVPRHEAGKPGARRINPLRVSHWRDELVKTFRPIVLDVRHETVLAILRAAGEGGAP